MSVNLCKRALDVTSDVIVEAKRNADILTINDFHKMFKAICITTKRRVKKSKVITRHNCIFYNISDECHLNTFVKLSIGS